MISSLYSMIHLLIRIYKNTLLHPSLFFKVKICQNDRLKTQLLKDKFDINKHVKIDIKTYFSHKKCLDPCKFTSSFLR